MMALKPYSYHVQVKDAPVHKMIYLPLDALDTVFINASFGANMVPWERSVMLTRLEGLNAGENFTIEVESLIEYVPTGNFTSWVNPRPSKIDTNTSKVVASLASSHPKEMFAGIVPPINGRHDIATFLERFRKGAS